MDRINIILKHELFNKYIKEIETAEIGRKYCLHGFEHAMDVARIAYIINLEEGIGYKKDVIYAMALLHDLGRAKEYAEGTNHHEAGCEIAEKILKDANYSRDEIEEIAEAVLKHKHNISGGSDSLKSLLYKADKISRNCFYCKSYRECYWDESLKNKTIKY